MKTLKLTALCAALAGFSHGALALDPMPIRFENGLSLTPTVSAGSRYDDNFRAYERNRDSSWITSIRPDLLLEAEGDKVRHSLRYALDHEIFHSSSGDTNTDHFVNAASDFQFDVRNRLGLRLDYSRMENTATDQQKQENDRPRQLTLGAAYTYGAAGASGQVRLNARQERIRYDNRGRTSAGARINADLERDSRTLGAAFLYRVLADTYGVIELRHTDHDYVSNRLRDGSKLDMLLGAEWAITAKTSGSVRFGRESRRFDASGISKRTGTTWDGAVTWSPRTYSVFNLGARQAIDEGSDGASGIRSQSWTVGWRHTWSDFVYSTISYEHAKRNYLGADSARRDKRDDYRLGLNYSVRRWLDVGVSYANTRNDSNRDDQSYRRNVYGVTINASF